MLEEKKSRFNPWPVTIIVFFSVAICAAVGFVIFCTRQKVDLVAADYYDQEVRTRTSSTASIGRRRCKHPRKWNTTPPPGALPFRFRPIT